MKVYIAMVEQGNDVLLAVGRDEAHARSSLSAVVDAGAAVVKEVKVGKAYRNLEPIHLHTGG